jgi:hypothetical protein
LAYRPRRRPQAPLSERERKKKVARLAKFKARAELGRLPLHDCSIVYEEGPAASFSELRLDVAVQVCLDMV